MRWSFSRVNAYATCPKMFYLTYVDKAEKTDNAFALWGSFCHSLLERFFKGELLSFELMDAYKEEYSSSVTVKFPPNKWRDLNLSYYESGLEYFRNITDLPCGVDVIGVEEEVETEFCGYKFIGYIDLILRVKDTGEIIIVDHKSKSAFASPEEQRHYAFQLYLYAQHVKEKYGVFPTRLVFNMFRVGDVVKIDFNEDDFNNAVHWFVGTIDHIYADKHFLDKIKLEYKDKGKKLREYKYADFFCAWLCSVRFSCNRSKIKVKKKEEDYP